MCDIANGFYFPLMSCNALFHMPRGFPLQKTVDTLLLPFHVQDTLRETISVIHTKTHTAFGEKLSGNPEPLRGASTCNPLR